MIELVSTSEELRPRICVIGVGGAGGNAVANMIKNKVGGVEFIAANTDAQALRATGADRIIQLGRTTTEGLGAGSRAELGRAAAEESLAEIERVLTGAHMCFVAAGLGGGTGTGAAPVIARAARAKGILTVGVVTRPFAFEGDRRARVAEAGLEELQQHVDSLIVVPNQNLFRIANPDTTFKEAFDLADEVLQQGVSGITDLMTMPGLINLDFADVRTVMADMGRAMMGTGEAGGEDRALRAADAAIANPLLDESIEGASGLLISIIGGEDMRLMEVDEAAQRIRAQADPEADIIWGSAFDPKLEGRIRVSIVATGINRLAPAVAAPTLESLASKAPTISRPAAKVPSPVFAAMPFKPAPATAHAPVQMVMAPELDLVPTRANAAEAPLPSAMSIDEMLAPVETLEVQPEVEAMLHELVLNRVVADAPSLEAPAKDRLQGRDYVRGPSLFERMAMVARGAVIRRESDRAAGLSLRQEPVFLDRRNAA
jgi:cell division protein FtsZ